MEHIRTARDGGVGVITIDRRERFNALDVMTARDLRNAVRALSQVLFTRFFAAITY
jgi:enoyl-CoA hydratase/carnithine racemase